MGIDNLHKLNERNEPIDIFTRKIMEVINSKIYKDLSIDILELRGSGYMITFNYHNQLCSELIITKRKSKNEFDLDAFSRIKFYRYNNLGFSIDNMDKVLDFFDSIDKFLEERFRKSYSNIGLYTYAGKLEDITEINKVK